MNERATATSAGRRVPAVATMLVLLLLGMSGAYAFVVRPRRLAASAASARRAERVALANALRHARGQAQRDALAATQAEHVAGAEREMVERQIAAALERSAGRDGGLVDASVAGATVGAGLGRPPPIRRPPDGRPPPSGCMGPSCNGSGTHSVNLNDDPF